MKRFALALMLAGLTSGPVLAGTDAPQHCGLFCKVWRNVTGRVHVADTPAAWDDGTMAAPTIEQEARTPRPAELVAVHGEVLRKTRAEREREKAVMAAEIKQIDALRGEEATPTPAARDAGARTLGQAD